MGVHAARCTKSAHVDVVLSMYEIKQILSGTSRKPESGVTPGHYFLAIMSHNVYRSTIFRLQTIEQHLQNENMCHISDEENFLATKNIKGSVSILSRRQKLSID